MADITVLALQDNAGRKTQYVRAFGHRTSDPKKLLVEVALNIPDASFMFIEAQLHGKFPEIEVPDNAWIYAMSIGDLKIVRTKETK